ncbi:MAG: hypothetical protein AB9866_04335 [Syntrophobacteraceae bacterium]
MKLANALTLTLSDDESAAESSLTLVGIAPRNGWISDYPVTPDIIAEVRDSVKEAADAGRLKISKSEAILTVDKVSMEMDLPIKVAGEQYDYASSAPPPDQYRDPSVLQDYYYDSGPPVVTYYPPPWEYGYLYSWVPYPFWWGGFGFGGFFVLNHFDRVVFHKHFHRNHGNFVNRNDVRRVSNNIRGRDGRVSRINPATRLARSDTRVSSGRRGIAAADARQGARSIANRNLERSGRTSNSLSANRASSGSGSGRDSGLVGRDLDRSGNSRSSQGGSRASVAGSSQMRRNSSGSGRAQSFAPRSQSLAPRSFAPRSSGSQPFRSAPAPPARSFSGGSSFGGGSSFRGNVGSGGGGFRSGGGGGGGRGGGGRR